MIRSWLAALWYRLMHAPDPYDGCFAVAPDPVDAVHDEYQRAAWFTGEAPGCPVVAGPEPHDVAVDDAQVSQLIWECLNVQYRRDRGDDIYAGARHEPSPEVSQ